MITVGIDIGTTNSSAAVLIDEQVEVLRVAADRAFGDPASLPTAVYLEKDTICIGHKALSKRVEKPENFRKNFKRDFGTSIVYEIDGKTYCPEDFYCEILHFFKESIEQKYNDRVGVLCLTHPPGYTDEPDNMRCNLLKWAAEKAGFTDTNIILVDEPSAAAAGYAVSKPMGDGDKLLIYDFGGGTLDLSLVVITSNGFKFLAEPVSNLQCGGADFDDAVRAKLFEQVSAIPEIDEEDLEKLLQDDGFKQDLDEAAIKIKHLLSSQEEASDRIQIAGLKKSTILSLERSKFEEAIRPKVDEARVLLESLLHDAMLSFQDIDRVILVGGSCRVPLVQKMLASQFGEEKIYQDADLELAVCKGVVHSVTSPETGPLMQGQGTLNDPYLIETPIMFSEIRDNLSAHYRLAVDIDLRECGMWTPIGNDTIPFSGSLDGNGHTIFNLRVDENSVHSGLFGVIIQGSITNLTIDNASVHGGEYTGVLAGKVLETIVRNCTISGGVTGSECVGGIIGGIFAGDVENCTVSCNITGIKRIGGFAGVVMDSSIKKCSAKERTVRGDEMRVGGIFGVALGKSSIVSCRSDNMTISGNDDVGGIAGILFYPATVERCSSSSSVIGNTVYTGGIVGAAGGKTTNCTFSGKVVTGDSIVGHWFNEGSGTKEDPYRVYLPEGLDLIRNNLSAHYKLAADISLQQYTNWVPIGSHGNSFSGSLNGDGHTIRNLRIDRPKSAYQGLFGSLMNAEICYLRLSDIQVWGGERTGGLSGAAFGTGIINNIIVEDGNITGSNFTGGLVGVVGIDTNQDKNNYYIVQCNVRVVIRGDDCVGGISGEDGIIQNCTVDVKITGYKMLGGIVGRITKDYGRYIVNCTCVNTCTIVGCGGVGGIVGIAYEAANIHISNCRTSGMISARNRKAGGIAGTADCPIINCSSDCLISSPRAAGGITGWYWHGKFENQNIQNWIFSGTIHCNDANSQGSCVGQLGRWLETNEVDVPQKDTK